MLAMRVGDTALRNQVEAFRVRYGEALLTTDPEEAFERERAVVAVWTKTHDRISDLLRQVRM
jgi:hypothetical protein